MEIIITIYNSSKGDGFYYYTETINASTFDELEKNILHVYSQAQQDGVIKISEKYEGEWVPTDDDEVILETSLVIKHPDHEIDLGSCMTKSDHISGWYPPIDYEYESLFGKLDKEPSMCDVSDYFEFYLSKMN